MQRSLRTPAGPTRWIRCAGADSAERASRSGASAPPCARWHSTTPAGLATTRCSCTWSIGVAQRLLSRFTSQGLIHHDLSKACLTTTRDAIPRVILLGRLAIYGERAARLHEEIVAITARWTDRDVRGGALKPFGRSGGADVTRIAAGRARRSGSEHRPGADAGAAVARRARRHRRPGPAPDCARTRVARRRRGPVAGPRRSGESEHEGAAADAARTDYEGGKQRRPSTAAWSSTPTKIGSARPIAERGAVDSTRSSTSSNPSRSAWRPPTPSGPGASTRWGLVYLWPRTG